MYNVDAVTPYYPSKGISWAINHYTFVRERLLSLPTGGVALNIVFDWSVQKPR